VINASVPERPLATGLTTQSVRLRDNCCSITKHYYVGSADLAASRSTALTNLYLRIVHSSLNLPLNSTLSAVTISGINYDRHCHSHNLDSPIIIPVHEFLLTAYGVQRHSADKVN
jgi:hypothetical protein